MHGIQKKLIKNRRENNKYIDNMIKKNTFEP